MKFFLTFGWAPCVAVARKWLDDWTKENQDWYVKDAEGKTNSRYPQFQSVVD